VASPKNWRLWGLLACGLIVCGIWLVNSWQKGGDRPSNNSPTHQVDTPIQFREVQDQAGIHFHHFNAARNSLLPEDTGSGLGWADYDNDGDDDLYLVNFAGPFLMAEADLMKRPGNRLYRNDGNGKFTDVTDESGVGHVGWDYGCLWFDYDNDGWLDLAVTHYHGVVLYRNRGDRTFADATEAAGLAGINRFLQGLTAGDYDLDGDLDLYLCGYVDFDRERARNRPLVSGRPAVWTNPVSYAALPNILLQNEGNGTFIDVTERAGVANAKGKTMQALFCDFDNDGWPDLYVGNDVGTADALFHNRRDGTFEDTSLIAGTFDRRASMGIAVGDVWHRGVMDLFTTHWVAEDHALWKNLSIELDTSESGEGRQLLFEDVGPQTGIVAAKTSPLVGWGTGLYDFNNDGHLDMMISNGSTIEDELTLEVLSDPKLIPQASQLLWNNGKGRFIDVSLQAGDFFEQQLVNRGLAFSDYNQDGRIDAAVLRHNGPAILLENVTEPAGHWLQVRLKGTKNNVFGVGARVEVKAGGLVHSRQCVLSSSYLSSDSLLCHFGLGNATTVDYVKVYWPGGTQSRQEDLIVDQVVMIHEDAEQVLTDENSK
jgi:hypothetical protein